MTDTLRANMRAAIEAQGLAIRETARRAGVSHGGLSDFLSGKKATYAVDTVAKIAAALGLTVAELLGETPPDAGPIRMLGLDQLHLSLRNPRKAVDLEALAELAASIERHGLLQNLVVRPSDDGRFEIVAGERRFRALDSLAAAGKWAGEVPALVIEAETDEQLALALIENLARVDLDPLDEAEAYQVLTQHHGWTTARLAETLGRTQRLVQQRLALLGLGHAARAALKAGAIGPGVARQLARADEAQQQSLVDRIRAGVLVASEEQVRKEIGAVLAEPKQPAPRVFEDAPGRGGRPAGELFEIDDDDEADDEADTEIIEPNANGVFDPARCQRIEYEHRQTRAALLLARCPDGWRYAIEYHFAGSGVGVMGAGGLARASDAPLPSRAEALREAVFALRDAMADAINRGAGKARATRAQQIMAWALSHLDDETPADGAPLAAGGNAEAADIAPDQAAPAEPQKHPHAHPHAVGWPPETDCLRILMDGRGPLPVEIELYDRVSQETAVFIHEDRIWPDPNEEAAE